MFLVYAALVALVTVPLLGGRLGALADVRLRRPWLVAAALGAQVVVTTLLPGLFDGTGSAVHLATYGLLGAFVWANRHLPGLAVVAAGGVANFAAITANGGVMPASPGALRTAGMPYDKAGEFANSAALDDARLGFLGDVLAIPASWPASNVFSVGDVLILAGLVVALHTLAESRLRPGVAVGYARLLAARRGARTLPRD